VRSSTKAACFAVIAVVKEKELAVPDLKALLHMMMQPMTWQSVSLGLLKILKRIASLHLACDEKMRMEMQC